MIKRPLPERAKAMAVQVLLSTFAGAFGVRAPNVARLPYGQALWAFREFSAVCMEEALAAPGFAAEARAKLARRACKLGTCVRALLAPQGDELAACAAALYRTIRIDVRVHAPGELCFCRCYFSERYTPQACAFMSAFDSGFLRGLCGWDALEFSERITQGAPCCIAAFAERGGVA